MRRRERPRTAKDRCKEATHEAVDVEERHDEVAAVLTRELVRLGYIAKRGDDVEMRQGDGWRERESAM